MPHSPSEQPAGSHPDARRGGDNLAGARLPSALLDRIRAQRGDLSNRIEVSTEFDPQVARVQQILWHPVERNFSFVCSAEREDDQCEFSKAAVASTGHSVAVLADNPGVFVLCTPEGECFFCDGEEPFFCDDECEIASNIWRAPIEAVAAGSMGSVPMFAVSRGFYIESERGLFGADGISYRARLYTYTLDGCGEDGQVGSAFKYTELPFDCLAFGANGLLLASDMRGVHIYAQAGVKLEPYPFNPQYYDITSLAIFVQHNTVIEQQRAGYPLGPIVGGIKKDVVLTNLLIGNSDRVAIYGWHRLNGTPIQPLYIGHNYLHVDYSHGIRLVKQKMIVDGQEMFITDVLRDANLCPMISDEGAIAFLGY